MADSPQSWDVINTKVEFQGQQINKLADDTAKQFVDFRESTQNQLSGLREENRQQFSALNNSIEKLVGGLQQTEREKDREKRSNWISLGGTGVAAVIAATTILGTLATLRLTPIENDQKTTRDNINSIVATLDKITNKLDNFETRAELTDRNKTVDTLIESKADKIALDFAIKERKAESDRLRSDIATLDAKAEKSIEERTNLRIAMARIEAVRQERGRALERMQLDIDKRATAEALDGVRLRLNDQRDRINLVSNRLQAIFEKNFATPRDPCLDSGAGCQPKVASPDGQATNGGR